MCSSKLLVKIQNLCISKRDNKYCVKCGREISNDVKFCKYCGAKMRINESATNISVADNVYSFCFYVIDMLSGCICISR